MKYARLPIDQLVIDRRYQRDLDERHVARIADEFDSKKLGVLEVSRRNGKAAVFDGQHRLEALRLVGRDKVPCLVHEGLTPQEEADLFVALQRQRKRISAFERFQASLFSGDPEARDIASIIEGQGFTLGQGDGDIKAVTSLERAYRRYGRDNLIAALGLVGAIWRGDDKHTDGQFIAGTAKFCAEYGNRIDSAARSRLAAVSPTQVLRRAKDNTTSAGGGASFVGGVCAQLRKASGVRGRPLIHRAATETA